ncbi:MAG: glycosyltransferase [PVC group bacterium]|nr:glycosyltransferase [PVC group bacterium]
MSELVSVIITSYNHGEYLKERLDTILGQTYKNIEIIVVDDCSIDNSLEVLKGYAGYSNVKVIALKENVGYALACHKGVGESKGNFIIFAESDDFSEPEQIEMLFDVIVKDERIGVAWCRSNIVDENGKVLGDDYSGREKSFRLMCKESTFIRKEYMQRLFLSSCVIPNMSAALLRRSFFEQTGGLSPNYKACADWDFWNRMAMVCDFFYITKTLNNFRTHGQTVRNTFESNLQAQEILKLTADASNTVYSTRKGRLKSCFNLGYIGAYMIIYSLGNRFKNAIFIYKEGSRYVGFFIFFLLFGFLKNFWKYIGMVFNRQVFLKGWF